MDLLVDPLRQSEPLPYVETFHPIGFPVEIRTNSETVLQTAREAYGSYRLRMTSRPLRISVAVQASQAGVPEKAAFRLRDDLFVVVCDEENFATCDLDSGVGSIWINSAVERYRALMRYRFLESMIFSMLAHQNVTPLHAACASRNGRALLLNAPSGTGKTTLSYACAKAGWTFLSDDVSYLLRDSSDVLGKPYLIRFVEGAAQHFPELRLCERFTDLHGEVRIELPTEGLLKIEERAEVDRLVFLERREAGGVSVAGVSKEEAMVRMIRELPRYSDAVCRQHVESIARLMDREPVCLTYSRFEDAVHALGQL